MQGFCLSSRNVSYAPGEWPLSGDAIVPGQVGYWPIFAFSEIVTGVDT